MNETTATNRHAHLSPSVGKYADQLGLTVTQFNSPTRDNEANGFRVWPGREARKHFERGCLAHCKNLEHLNYFLAGYSAGRAA